MNRSGIRPFFRTGALAATSVLACVAALSACGGSSDDVPAAGGVSPSASPPPSASATVAAAAKSLASAELDKASLTASDLTGFEVEDHAMERTAGRDPRKTEDRDCVTVGHALQAVALGDPVADAQRSVTFETHDVSINTAETIEELNAATLITDTTVTLASYDSEDEAKAALKSLRTGIAACDGDFEYEVYGAPQDVDTVDTAKSPDVGDEAVAFDATVTRGSGDPGPMRVVVFRHGHVHVHAHFSTVDITAEVSGDDWGFPAVLANTQAAKLG